METPYDEENDDFDEDDMTPSFRVHNNGGDNGVSFDPDDNLTRNSDINEYQFSEDELEEDDPNFFALVRNNHRKNGNDKSDTRRHHHIEGKQSESNNKSEGKYQDSKEGNNNYRIQRENNINRGQRRGQSPNYDDLAMYSLVSEEPPDFDQLLGDDYQMMDSYSHDSNHLRPEVINQQNSELDFDNLNQNNDEDGPENIDIDTYNSHQDPIENNSFIIDNFDDPVLNDEVNQDTEDVISNKQPSYEDDFEVSNQYDNNEQDEDINLSNNEQHFESKVDDYHSISNITPRYSFEESQTNNVDKIETKKEKNQPIKQKLFSPADMIQKVEDKKQTRDSSKTGPSFSIYGPTKSPERMKQLKNINERYRKIREKPVLDPEALLMKQKKQELKLEKVDNELKKEIDDFENEILNIEDNYRRKELKNNNDIELPISSNFLIKLFIEGVYNLPDDIKNDIYLQFQITPNNKLKILKTKTSPVYKNKVVFNDKIEMNCNNKIDYTILKIDLIDSSTESSLGYISYNLSNKISNQYPFHLYNRTSIGLIPILLFTIEYSDNIIESKPKIDIINYEKVNVESPMDISIKKTRNDELYSLSFNVEVYRHKSQLEFYMRYENKKYQLYTEKIYNMDSIETECTKGITLMNDYNDVNEQAMRNWIVKNIIPPQIQLIKWLINRSTIILSTSEILMTFELRPPEMDETNDQSEDGQPIDPPMVSYMRLNQLKESFDKFHTPKEKVHIIDSTLKEVNTLGIPVVTFDMKELETISRMTGNVSRPYRKQSPSKMYTQKMRKDEEYQSRILGDAKSIINNGINLIEQDHTNAIHQQKLNTIEEIKMLNMIEDRRIKSEEEKEEKKKHLYAKDAQAFISAKRIHDSKKREELINNVNRTKMKKIAHSNIKGSYWGPAPDLMTKPVKTISNNNNYYDINGTKHSNSEKPKIDHETQSLIYIDRIIQKLEIFIKAKTGNNLASLFRNYSLAGNYTINYSDFKIILDGLYLNIQDWEYQLLYGYFDFDHKGFISLFDFYHLYFIRRHKPQWERVGLYLQTCNDYINLIDLNKIFTQCKLNLLDWEYKQLLSVINIYNNDTTNKSYLVNIIKIRNPIRKFKSESNIYEESKLVNTNNKATSFAQESNNFSKTLRSSGTHTNKLKTNDDKSHYTNKGNNDENSSVPSGSLFDITKSAIGDLKNKQKEIDDILNELYK